MTKKVHMALLMLLALLASTNTFSQCSICSTPAAPAEYGGTYTATQYQGTAIQLWAVAPSVAICERDWYKVVGTDTISLGTGDTLSVTADTTCKYIARNKNTCSGTNYYSSYVIMGNITVIDSPTVPTYTIGYTPVICSGTQTNIMLFTPTGTGFQYLRNDTTNVKGSVSGTSFNGPLSITLTNSTGSSQVVRILLRMYKSSPTYYADNRVIYVTVLPSAPPSGAHCYAPSTPNPFFSSVDTRTYYKGSQIQLLADTTVVADTVQWYKVVGTDTTFAGNGYAISVTVDTACQYIARNGNACGCSSGSVYYSAWKQMANYSVSTAYSPPVLMVANYMPTIASGTQMNLVSENDNDTASFNGFTLYRDNAYVSGTTSGSGGSFTLTNTTSVPQLVRFICRSNGFLNHTNYGYTVSGYVTVLPSTSTAPAGNHCSLPALANPLSPSYYTNSFGNIGYYIKGALANLDVSNAFNFNPSTVSADSLDWYQVKWPGDTIFLGNSFPINARMDTTCSIFVVSKNVCYWSDSSKHIYNSAKSQIGYVSTTITPDSVVTFTNNAPNLCNGRPTNISAYAKSGSIVPWRRNNTKVTGLQSGNFYYTFPTTLSDTLSDTTSTPQIVNFEAHNYTTVSGHTYIGSSALATILTYPSCGYWSGNTIAVHPALDSICSGDTATLVSDTLPCYGGTRYRWSTGDTTQSIRATTSGTYTVTATSYCGCSVTASSIIVVRSNSFAVANDTICSGSTATVSATGGLRYQWNNGDTTASFTTSTAGTYTVTATNIYGCRGTASGTVTVNPVPFPPAGPISLSTCSDSIYTFNISYVSAWGNMLQWSLDSSFTSTSLDSPVSGSYIVHPFAVAVPGDSFATVWMRTLSGQGCLSSSVSVVLQTYALPAQKSIYSVDTIVPQDSTALIIVANSDSGVLYTLQIGDSVVSSATGNGDTLYLTTSPIDTTTVFDVYGTNAVSYCSKKLYGKSYTPSVIGTSKVYVTVSNSPPVACKADTLYVSILNNSNTPIDTAIVNLVLHTPDFSLNPYTYNSYIGTTAHAAPPVTVNDSLYRIVLHTLPADSTWSFSMILHVNCSVIPDSVPTSGGSIVPKNDTADKISVWVNALDTPVGVNGVGRVTATNPYPFVLDGILYPLFDRDLSATTTFNSANYTTSSNSPGSYKGCASFGDTIIRRSYFNNRGLATFTGGINIMDSSVCGSMTLIKAKLLFGSTVDSLVSTDFPRLLGTGYDYALGAHGDSVAAGSDIILEETFVVNACLGLSCTSVVRMIWGCDTTNLCQTSIPDPYFYQTSNCKLPLLRISRILPVSNMSGEDWYWDSTCMNTYTKWEFEVQNYDTSSTATLTNVHVVLNKGNIGSYSYINKDSTFKMGYARANYGGALPSTDTLSYTLLPITAHISDSIIGYSSVCLQNTSAIDSPFLSMDIRISMLKRGDKFFFSFYTYQCCPSDVQLFNNGFDMNDWTITAYGSYCGIDGVDSMPAVPYSNPTATYPLYSPNISSANGDFPNAISPYHYNGTTDFGPIDQIFVNVAPTMVAPETDTFLIRNLTLSGLYVEYQQMLFLHGTDLNTASNPSFRLLVDVNTGTGLWVEDTNDVFIQSPYGQRWPGVTVSHSYGFSEFAFDIADLAAIDPTINGSNGVAAFDSFFTNSFLHYPLTAYCPASQPFVTCMVSTYLEPRLSIGCDTCKIPLAQVSGAISVDCPGCITPGLVTYPYYLKRINYGLPDSMDNGLATGLNEITPSYDKFTSVDVYQAMVGDTLQSNSVVTFFGGDNTTGIDYDTWRAFWAARGDSNAYFRYLFREQNIPYSDSLGLTLLSDTLYYIPASDTSERIMIPLPVTYPYVSHIGDDFVFRLSIDSIRSLSHNDTLTFEPNDKYRFISYYRICKNYQLPDSTGYISATIMDSYFTTPYDSSLIPRYDTGAIAVDYYNNYQAGFIHHDSVIDPHTQLFYLCTGNYQPFTFDYVQYDISGPNDSWDINYSNNNTRCQKNIQMALVAQILGKAQVSNPQSKDDFPFEFRPIPGLTSGDQISINSPGSPYAYLIKSSNQCYNFALQFTQTNTWVSSTFQYSQVLSSGYTAAAAGPYESYSFPSLFAYATAQNYNTNANLLLGDEYFQQDLVFQLTAPVCAGCPDTLVINTDTSQMTILPSLSLCSGLNRDTLYTANLYTFIRPLAQDSPVALLGVQSADTSSFVITQVVKITRDNPDYLYVYIDSSGIPSGLSIDSITPYVSSLNSLDTPRHVGPYLLFDLGFGPYSYLTGKAYTQYDTLKIYFHWKNCPPSLGTSTVHTGLPFYINWQCVDFPTTLPDTSCHTPVYDSIPLNIYPIVFNNNYVLTEPRDTFSGCDVLQYSIRIYAYSSGNVGEIYNLADSLVLPTGLNLVPGSLMVSHNNSAPTLTTMSHHSVIMPDSIFHAGDSITLSFSAVANCYYDGKAPTDTFYGTSFCGSSLTSLGIKFDSLVRKPFTPCAPKFSYDSVTNPLCYGSSNGRIAIEVYGGTSGGFHFSWSAGLGTVDTSHQFFTAINVPPGRDTITVTDPATGCSNDTVVTLKSPYPLVAANASVINPVCVSLANGAINITVTGGTMPYTSYRWSPAATTQNLAYLPAGIYKLTVTDHQGCTATLSDTLHNVDSICCVSTDTPISVASALTFAGGTSTALLHQIATAHPLSGYVSTANTLSGMPNDLYINGMLTLDTDLTLINCPNIIFNQNGGIFTNGHTLIITGSVLYACGDTMWLGINDSLSGSLVKIANSPTRYAMIRDARRGVYMHKGGELSAIRCRFVNNWDGIYVDGTGGIPYFSVSGCLFKTDFSYGTLKADPIDNPTHLGTFSSAYSDVGIYIKSPTGGTALATVGSMTAGVDSFTDINCGILCYQNSLEVVHCVFDSITVLRSRFGGYNPYYLGRGIYVSDPTSSSSNYTLKVGDRSSAGADTFGYCFRGLDEIGNTGAVNVIGNRITDATNTGIYIGPDNPPSVYIAYNTLDVTKKSNEIQTGICINTSHTGWDSIIGNNMLLIDSLYYGSSTNDTAAATGIAIISSGNKAQFTVDSNTIGRAQRGIFMSSNLSIYLRGNTVNLWPIPWSIGTASYWSGISSVSDKNLYIMDNLIDGNPYHVTRSTYTPDSLVRGKEMGIYVRSQSAPISISCNGIQNTDWCIAQAGAVAPAVAVYDNRFFASKTGVTLFANGYIGPQGSGSLRETKDNEWDTTGTMQFKMGVFNALGTPNPFYLRAASFTSYTRYNPNLIEQVIGGFQFPVTTISSPSNSITGCSLPHPTFPHRVFADVQPYLESIALDTLTFASDSIDNLKWSEESLIELIQRWPAVLDSSTVITNYYKTVGSSSYTQLMQVFYNMQNDSDAANLGTYQSINNGVSPADQNEQNLQTINGLYLNYFMAMPDSFAQTGNLMDSTDLSALYGVASQCYLPGGPAVFLARNMYWAATRDISIGFNDDCATGTGGEYKILRPENSKAIDNTYVFSVYPNPMDKQNSLNVQCSEAGEITFYNLLGQITYKGSLISGINIFNCIQLSCDNNVILYRAKMMSGKTETGKIMTLK